MDKKQKTDKKGFTLIELMIVIVIVGILAAVAIPKFTKAQYKAVVSEFPTVLTQIYTAEGAYEAENMRYTACDTSNIDSLLGISIPSGSSFLYAVSSDSSTYSATAKAKEDIGDIVASTDTAAINQDGVKTASLSFLKYAPTWK